MANFASGSGIFTPAGYAAALTRFGSDLNKAIASGMRSGMTSARFRAIAKFQSRGIGRSVFGKKGDKAARGMIKVGKVKISGSSYIASLTATGLAAIQETGGHFKPHLIAPKNAKALVYRTKAGVLHVSTKPVMHPGATHPRMPFLTEAIQNSASRFQSAIDKAIQKTANMLRVA